MNEIELAEEEAACKDLLQVVQGFLVETDEAFGKAAELTKEVKREYKQIDARLKSATDPLNASLKQIRGWFKPMLDLLSSCETVLKQKMAAYQMQKVEDSQAALKRLGEAAVSRDLHQVQLAAESLVEIPKAKGVGIRQVWDWKIADESQVPRQFLTVNASAVNAHVKESSGEPAAIPGIVFFSKSSVTVRT
jgi:hypothetical protein